MKVPQPILFGRFRNVLFTRSRRWLVYSQLITGLRQLLITEVNMSRQSAPLLVVPYVDPHTTSASIGGLLPNILLSQAGKSPSGRGRPCCVTVMMFRSVSRTALKQEFITPEKPAQLLVE